jgi:hypothetical protein
MSNICELQEKVERVAIQTRTSLLFLWSVDAQDWRGKDVVQGELCLFWTLHLNSEPAQKVFNSCVQTLLASDEEGLGKSSSRVLWLATCYLRILKCHSCAHLFSRSPRHPPGQVQPCNLLAVV